MKPKKTQTSGAGAPRVVLDPKVAKAAEMEEKALEVRLDGVDVIPTGRGRFPVVPKFTGTTRKVASFWTDVPTSDVPRIKKAIEDGKAVTKIVRKVDPEGKVYAQFQSTVHTDGGSVLFHLDLKVMRVMVYEPGKPGEVRMLLGDKDESNDHEVSFLTSMQRVVGGYIELHNSVMPTGVRSLGAYDVLVNEDGLELKLPENRRVWKDGEGGTTFSVLGTFFVCRHVKGEDGDDFGSLTDEDVELLGRSVTP